MTNPLPSTDNQQAQLVHPRRYARELALLTLFQLEDQTPEAQAQASLKQLIRTAVETLSDLAKEQVQNAIEVFSDVHQGLQDYEKLHPENLETPLDAPLVPVSLPNSQEMIQQISSCLQAADWLAEALRIPKLALITRAPDIEQYTIQLIELVNVHREEIDTLIETYAEDWKITRFAKMDRTLLRLAVAEMRYIPKVDLGISINESVELAKQFSTEESYRFINGILGRIAEQLQSDLQEAPHTQETSSHA